MPDVKPENIPLHLVRIARDAFRAHHGTASDNSDLDDIRAMLAAVLPVAEQEVRESIGGDFDAAIARLEQRANDAGSDNPTGRTVLLLQIEVYRTLAAKIRSGGQGDGHA